ncbi:MAG: 2-phosphosulfolactate phosphatase [Bacteroidales bacterium]|nr:2-phosphosulfolactate phosphatase [Bacteroidales bacterium]
MGNNTIKRKIRVSYTPAAFSEIASDRSSIAVVVDVFRASTTICAAFQRGIKKVIPVVEENEAIDYKRKGFLVAGERDGIKLDFCDYGNSPLGFPKKLTRKNLVITTTNGTRAINAVKGYDEVLIGSFCNIGKLIEHLSMEPKDLLIQCAGWKGDFSIEDSLFAGAFTESLVISGLFEISSDTALAAFTMWERAKADLAGFLRKSQHYQRLKKIGYEADMIFALKSNTTNVLPVWEDYYLKDKIK